jgi:hypothetical protein
MYRGQILGRNWDKSFNSFPLTIHSPPLSPEKKKWFDTGLKCNIVYGNIKSENTQDYGQKRPQRDCTFMNLASVERVSRNEQGMSGKN